MSGSSRQGALVALSALALSLTGAALAAPVPVLAIEPAGVLLQLDEQERYDYSYRQSIYLVTVTEEHRRVAGRLRIERVRSSDIRAVEYFRWDGPITREGEEHVQSAPPNGVGSLAIAITAQGRQELRAARWSLVLRDRFGESVVTLRLTAVPTVRLFAATP